MRTLTTMTRLSPGLITSIAIAIAAAAFAIPAAAAALERAACEADGAFVWVEGGSYIAGSDQTERDFAYRLSAQVAAKSPGEIPALELTLRAHHWFDAEPARETLTLPGFCIARTPVTNTEYHAFLRQSRHRGPGISAADYERQGFLVHPYSEVTGFLWAGDGPRPGAHDHPVVLVSYDDALHFAVWKGVRDSRTYRLPTAAEWEKAARGTDGRYFPWGNDWRAGATNWSGSGLNHSAPVSAFPGGRSPYGADGLGGNVFEFTSTLEAAPDGVRTIMKGCSWDDLPGFCRPAYRHTRPAASRHILFGFRLVRE